VTLRTFTVSVQGSPSGTLTDGASFPITGSGFGTKPQAAPLHFDRFESGTAGANLISGDAPTVGSGYTAISINSSTTVAPRYDSSQAFSGSKSLLMDYTASITASSCSARVNLGGAQQEVYYSYRTRKQIVGTQNTSSGQWNIKYARVGNVANGSFDSAASAPIFDNYIEQGGTAQSGPDNTTMRQYESSPDSVSAWYGGQPLSWDAWHRLEGYCKLPSPFNTATGKRYFKKNMAAAGTFSSYPGGWANPNGVPGFPTTAYDGAPWNTFTGVTAFTGFNTFITPFYCRESYSIYLWIDELWIDTTQARVEIGNAATWSGCTKRCPQPATAWADGSITVTLNKGNMSTGESAYAFVVKTDGTILEHGSIGAWT
jgi:hypothetical protein